jgi:hypothetical protein
MPIPAYAIGLGSTLLGNAAGSLFGKQKNPYQDQLSQQRMFNQNIQNQQYQLGNQNQAQANKFSNMYSRGAMNEMERLNNPDASNAMLRQAGAQMGNITGNAAQAMARYNASGNALNQGGGVTNMMMQDDFMNRPIASALSQGAVQYALGADDRRMRALGLAGQAYNQYQGGANTAFGTASGMANNMYNQYMGEAQQQMEMDAATQNQRNQIASQFGALGGQYINQRNADRDFGLRQDEFNFRKSQKPYSFT